jgi:hypothetical protein
MLTEELVVEPVVPVEIRRLPDEVIVATVSVDDVAEDSVPDDSSPLVEMLTGLVVDSNSLVDADRIGELVSAGCSVLDKVLPNEAVDIEKTDDANVDSVADKLLIVDGESVELSESDVSMLDEVIKTPALVELLDVSIVSRLEVPVSDEVIDDSIFENALVATCAVELEIISGVAVEVSTEFVNIDVSKLEVSVAKELEFICVSELVVTPSEADEASVIDCELISADDNCVSETLLSLGTADRTVEDSVACSDVVVDRSDIRKVVELL